MATREEYLYRRDTRVSFRRQVCSVATRVVRTRCTRRNAATRTARRRIHGHLSAFVSFVTGGPSPASPPATEGGESMPVTPPVTYPGVYVQEVPSGVRTIVGVGTSIGMFIGTSKRGPINQPRACLNYAAFRDTFGEDNTAGDLAQYVRLFFLNGG